MFKLYTFIDINNIKQDGVLRLSDMALIPPDELNINYQEYLEWVEDGNVAEEWNPEVSE
jgi:hypothetical protein